MDREKALENSGCMTWRVVDGTLLSMDTKAMALFGVDVPAARLEDLFITRVHSDDYIEVSRFFSAQGSAGMLSFRVVGRTGEILSLFAEVRRDGDAGSCTLIDISFAVNKGQETVYETLPALYVSYSGSPRILTFANNRARRMLGIEDGERSPFALDGMVCEDDLEKLAEAERYANETGRQAQLEFRIDMGSGRVLWLKGSVYSPFMPGGVPYFVMIANEINDIKRVEQELLLSNRRYQLLLSNSGDTYYEIDLNQNAFYKTTGGQAADGKELLFAGLPESLIDRGIIIDESQQKIYEIYDQLKKGSEKVCWTGQLKRSDGQVIWAQVTLFGIADSQGRPVQALGMLKDITREKELELRFQREEQYKAGKIKSALLVMTFSLSGERMLSLHQDGVQMELPVGGSPYSTALTELANNQVHPEDRAAMLDFFSLRRVSAEHDRRGVQGEYLDFRLMRSSGEYGWAQGVVNVLTAPDSGELICFAYISDIDAHKRQQLELKFKAESDALTGLLNRETLTNRVNHFLTFEAGRGGLHAMIMIDLDGFKQVNDNYGHQAGDEVLCQLADRLRTTSRTSDYLSRFGGDEYIIFMKNADVPDIVMQKARKICSICCALQVPGSDRPMLSASVGIAIAPNNGMSFDSLYSKADKAMYRAKHMGKNCIATYDEKLGDGVVVDLMNTNTPAQLIDRLTGYGNFDRFRLEAQDILGSSVGGERFGIYYCDIKNFKYINDVFGYAEGNRLLQRLADHLALNSGRDETFARLSGDMFVTLRRYSSRSELTERFERTVDFLHQLQLEGERPHRVEFCAGIYCIEKDEDLLPIEEMVDRANLAEKSVKQVPGSNMVFYVETMRELMIREKEIEQSMYQALRGEEFRVYYQPKIDIKSGNRVAGAEALVRWHKPGGGILMPSDFIPVFERNGFITQLDEYVLESICRMLRRQLDEGRGYVPVSVNVSRMALFSPNFVQRYVDIKNRYSIPPGLIELEFTENLAFENHILFREVVEKLKEAGFLCSLDNFGAGNSSFNLLRDMPIDSLKMDRLFFQQDSPGNTRQKAIISSVVTMAQALDMNIVTEGVEQLDQVDFLRSIGCDFVQGYVYSRPVPEDQLMEQVDRMSEQNDG